MSSSIGAGLTTCGENCCFSLIGLLFEASLDSASISTFSGSKDYISYFIGVPNLDPTGNKSSKCNIKVALAWDSQIEVEFNIIPRIKSNLKL